MIPPSTDQPGASILPVGMAYLAVQQALGSFTRAYRAQERARAMLIGWPILLLGPPLACGGSIALLTSSYVISAQMGLTGSDNYPQAIAGLLAFILIIIFGAIAVPMGWSMSASGTVVYLFRHGLIYSKGAQTLVLPWTVITRAQLVSAYRYRPMSLVIQTHDRRTITLHSIKDLKELAREVQQALAHKQ